MLCKRAAKRILDDNPSINELAVEAGYSSSQKFVEAFVDHLAVTPVEMKKLIMQRYAVNEKYYL
jgi:AraC-like DNA-binding protein